MIEQETKIREALKPDHVSFAELSRIEGFSGDLSICSSLDYNVVFWTHVSEDAGVLQRLCAEHAFHYQPASSVLVYLIEGVVPQLPVISERMHKEPHWLPVVLNLVGGVPHKTKRPGTSNQENAEPSFSSTTPSRRPSAGCLVRPAEGPEEGPRKALLCIVINL